MAEDTTNVPGVTKVSELPTAEPLTGSEFLLGVQAGESVKIQGEALSEIPALVSAVGAAASSAAAAEASNQNAQVAAAVKGVYGTTAQGLTATTNGQGFYIPSASGNGAVDLYLNSAGVAVFKSTVPNEVAVSLAKSVGRRGNYTVFGKPSNLQKVSVGSFDWKVTWTRLYVFSGQDGQVWGVEGVTDLVVANHQAAYIDLNEARNANGRYDVHVTTVSPWSSGVTAGSYIEDGKLILFSPENNILGGAVVPESYFPGANSVGSAQLIDANVLEAKLEAKLLARSKRAAYQPFAASAKVMDYNGNHVILTWDKFRVFRGMGQTVAGIAAGGPIQVNAGEALVVDLASTPNGSGDYVPYVSSGGYSTTMPAGAGLDDQIVYLYINDTGYGAGGPVLRNPVNPFLGRAWIKDPTCVLSFDPATRILSWSAPLILPWKVRGGSQRIKLPAGSITLTNQNYCVAYIDLNEVPTGGGADTPLTAIHQGQYFGAATDRFQGLAHQMPIFYWNTSTDYGPLSGFPVPSITGITAAPSADDIPVIQTAGQLRIFIKGSKGGSDRYLEYVLHRTVVANDGGVTPNSQSDLWRIEGVYECSYAGGFSFTRLRGAAPVVNTGEWECAIQETGKPDFIGGYHGDELLSQFHLLIDGVWRDATVAANYVCRRIEVVQVSTLYRCNTTTPVAGHIKRYDITARGIEILQDVTWQVAMQLDKAFLAMLPIKRLLNDTSGDQVTDRVVRDPAYTLEDVSAAGFTEVRTVSKVANLWGPTGISAEVEVLESPGLPNAGLTINSSNFYNKVYFDVCGPAYTTTVGEKWRTRARYRLNTSN